MLVDGSYYAFRSFYAIRSLTAPDGRPVNALFGVIKALKRMMADLKPTHAAVAFDVGLPTARLELLPDYKGNRAETPPDLDAQMPLIRSTVPLLGFRSLITEGEEADDLMASYTRAAREAGWETILATNDKDLMQLVGPGCLVYQPGKESYALLGAAEVEAKWGVAPALIGDLLALTGDSSDNIPGVPGVGPKTAARWLQEAGSLEALLADPEKIPEGKLREAFLAARDVIVTNRRMVALRDRLPLPIPLDELVIKPDWTAQVDLFRSLQFRTFLREAEAVLGSVNPAPASHGSVTQAELFD
ncbi:MAG: 5'-3' exonuclease H3TH domain-containing protein [Verrucomicrobiia bacterium]